MTLWLLVLACGLTCLGQVSQKLAVEHWRRVHKPSVTARLTTPWLWAALACMGLGLLLWLLVLQRMDVGIAYPMLGLNFVLVTLVARFAFHEPVDRRHWLGVALVMTGVVLLGGQA